MRACVKQSLGQDAGFPPSHPPGEQCPCHAIPITKTPKHPLPTRGRPCAANCVRMTSKGYVATVATSPATPPAQKAAAAVGLGLGLWLSLLLPPPSCALMAS